MDLSSYKQQASFSKLAMLETRVQVIQRFTFDPLYAIVTVSFLLYIVLQGHI